jgi:hypothetical protein
MKIDVNSPVASQLPPTGREAGFEPAAMSVLRVWTEDRTTFHSDSIGSVVDQPGDEVP